MESEMLGIRDEYIDIIKRDLLGPGSENSFPDAEHELISGSPEGRYSVGVLFPHNCKMNVDNDDTIEENADTAEESQDTEVTKDQNPQDTTALILKGEHASDIPAEDDDSLEEEVSLAAQNMPSSMGMTFLVDAKPDSVKCRIKFGIYRRALLQECVLPLNVSHPENVHIPDTLDQYISYDCNRKLLYFVKGGL